MPLAKVAWNSESIHPVMADPTQELSSETRSPEASGPSAPAAPSSPFAPAPRGTDFRGGDGRSGRGPQRGRRPRQPDSNDDREQSDLVEKVIFINRSAKVVKGGRRFSFSALVVVGDRKGRVGLGLGKAGEVSEAIKKGGSVAKQAMVMVALAESTIPHEVNSVFDGARVMLRPASTGTGVIAGKTVRAVLDAAGVRNVLSKSLGSNNAANVAKATLEALLQLRTRDEILKSRGIAIAPKVPVALAPATN